MEIKKYSLINFIKKSILYIYCLPLGLNRDGIERIWRKKYRKSLFKYLELDSKKNTLKMKKNGQSYIFVCWLQGLDEAPDIVKRCVESIKKYSEGYKVIIITDNNINDYISIPDYVLEKKQKGFIPNANYSDIIRTLLLCKYGGIWIDATVMLFDRIPEYLLEYELFFFQASFLNTVRPEVSSWFIYSKYPENPLLVDLKNSILNYWKYNKRLPDYYLFHDFVSLLAQSDKYREYWKKMPYFNNIAPHVLQKELLNKYDIERLNQIIHMSPIQKLTYKIEKPKRSNTNYDFFIKEIDNN